MTKRTSSQDTAILIIELLKRIPRNKYISAKELQLQLAKADLAFDIRTIQRHLKTLVESSHFPIDLNDKSKPYGYRWNEQAPGFTLSSLSIQESLILRMAQEHLKNLLPSSLMESMSAFFEEANRNINHCPNRSREIEWLSKIVVTPETQPLLPAELQEGVFNAVSTALYENKYLKVKFRNARGEVKEKTVMPLGMGQKGPRTYLVCRFEGYDDERSLALHRIFTAKVSSMTFERPKDFCLKKYNEEGRFTFGKGDKVRLSFSITKAAGLHILETRLSEDQTYSENDEYYEIKATVVKSERLKWWLSTFGEDVKDVSYHLVDETSDE